ncbi:hypothetical protein DSO57_1002044 [Entomophthora muscae]|uniref:Uncharacterized protein n=1 Tax=Entomophthora muscae TaxID=34485 RepID=A0ACC2SAN4_9FUNG|nr:hypothetical protein DSO57_1002044 [Entomophthora muscae]
MHTYTNQIFGNSCNMLMEMVKAIVATELPDLPANVSYNTQGVLIESPLGISNGMN